MSIRPSSKQVRKNIYTDIPQQFPGIYREDGPVFVEFVKSYYKWADTQQNDFRDAFAIRDIDTTFDRFLIHFRNKYLADLPVDTVTDQRFILKHIQDLYRRKGSKESLELLFQLFFNEEIEVFYPSNYLLRISDSKYGANNYLEMKPVHTIQGYSIRKGDKIIGDTSKAEAFVDEIVFQNLSGLLVPILYLSNVYGKFTTDDSIRILGVRGGVEIDLFPDEKIHGSISDVFINRQGRASNNTVGDKLLIKSNASGIKATAAVSKTSEAATAVIDFQVTDGGWGYSTAIADNKVQTSTVTLALRLFTSEFFDTGYTPNATVSAFPKVGDYFISDFTYSAGTAKAALGTSTLTGDTNFAYGQVIGVDEVNNLIFIDFPRETYALVTDDGELYAPSADQESAFDVYFYDKGYIVSGLNIITEFQQYLVDGSYEPGLEHFFEDDINGRSRFDITNSGDMSSADAQAISNYFESELTNADQREWIKTNIVDYIEDNIDRIVGKRFRTGDLSTFSYISEEGSQTIDLLAGNATDADPSDDISIMRVYYNDVLTTDYAVVGTTFTPTESVMDALLEDVDEVTVRVDYAINRYWEAIDNAELINSDNPHVSPGTNYPRSAYTTAASSFNDSAQYRIGSIKNEETVSFIPDVIGDFLEVELVNQAFPNNPEFTNYGMSGPQFENINTPIRDAFSPVTYTIGEIESLIVLDEGQNYQADVKSLITQEAIAQYDKRDVGVVFNSPKFVINAGEVMEQSIQVEQFETGEFVDYTVKGKYLRREGDVFYFRPNSFYTFSKDYPITFRGGSYEVLNVIRDDESNPLGQNAVIDGEALFARGQIEEVNVLDTGFRYEDGETVEIVSDEPTRKSVGENGEAITIPNPNYGKTVATATARVLGMGSSASDWLTTTSFLNDPTKVIHDNFYYQDYSFDIRSIISPDLYEDVVQDIVQPAGTKRFSSPLINTTNYVNVELDASMEIYNFEYQTLAVEVDDVITGELGYEEANVAVDVLVATLQTLDEELSNTITEDIND